METNEKRLILKAAKETQNNFSQNSLLRNLLFYFSVTVKQFNPGTLRHDSVGKSNLWFVQEKGGNDCLLVSEALDGNFICYYDIEKSLRFRVKDETSCVYEDAENNQWHLHFNNCEDMKDALGCVAFFKAKTGNFKTHVTQELDIGPKLNTKISSQSLLRISYSVDEVDSKGFYRGTLLDENDVWVGMRQNGRIPEFWQETLKELTHFGRIVILSSGNVVACCCIQDNTS